MIEIDISSRGGCMVNGRHRSHRNGFGWASMDWGWHFQRKGRGTGVRVGVHGYQWFDAHQHGLGCSVCIWSTAAYNTSILSIIRSFSNYQKLSRLSKNLSIRESPNYQKLPQLSENLSIVKISPNCRIILSTIIPNIPGSIKNRTHIA